MRAARHVDDAPRHRYFRFGLRTMFVVLTVFSIWLAYEGNWIRQRREFLAIKGVWAQRDAKFGGYPKVRPKAPGLLWLFGERGYDYVGIADESIVEVGRAERLFPEARVTYGFYFGGVRVNY